MRLRTIGLISTLALGLLAAPLPTEAQQTGKVYRIGFLRFSGGPPTTSSLYMGLQQGLRELGYVEGENLIIEHRSAERKRERRAEMAAELVRLKVDVIVIPGAPGLLFAAQRATRTIPIVMSGIRVDPVKAGFVVSLARPGGNITGMTNLSAKLHPKRLELLKEAFPRISRVAIIWGLLAKKQARKEVKAAGQALDIQIQSLEVKGSRRLEVLESALSAISQERPDGLIIESSALITRHQARIREFTAKRRMPTMYTTRRYVDAGGLMSYGANLPNLYRLIATYVDKILKGAKPGDLPVEQPTKFELIINLKTAKQIGVTIPPEVLFRADKLIK